ncbi:MAG: hypothetical protein LCH54_10250 [Bacteroidetes bacterium]|nr:hypothetical protein [Bacteroidota bacterium]
MPKLTQQEKDRLGPLIPPFGRNTTKPVDRKIVEDGEREKIEFEHLIYSGHENGNPHQFTTISIDEVEILRQKGGKWGEKSFLWVIDEETIKIIKEKNTNTLRSHKPEFVCHTNLTGNGHAFIGGEIYFCEDGRKFINFFSDRYGNPSKEQWEAAKSYFEKVGYTPLIDILEFLTS